MITPAHPPQSDRVPFSPLWALLIGIGIAFTPCVLPIYPLISAVILGNRVRLSTARVLLLSVIYVMGMAITYTLLGVAVAAAGLQFCHYRSKTDPLCPFKRYQLRKNLKEKCP